ncbi:phytanoyl-CoA dioxygenase family protein [Streptomyces sp. NPDC040750]|uniref:phytanoyl-CoA dioxygenase family protein n=1 Tax=Streptomyces sp. NPDC040750 TaxID=3154491 RepID=UPI003407D9E7
MLTKQQLATYDEQGYLLTGLTLSPEETACLKEEFAALSMQDTPDRILEKDGKTVRGLHGCHQRSAVFHDLVRHPLLLTTAMAVLGSEVYVHQFKINAKMPMSGDVWPWHQDYIFWQREDGMVRPNVVNVAVLLDDATEINGPLLFVPGSHKLGLIDVDRSGSAVAGGEAWSSGLSADLDYTISGELLAELTAEHGIEPMRGPAGSVMIFDSRIVHGSGTNMSPHSRGMALVTYNRLDNALAQVSTPRPEFLAARTAEALVAHDPGFTLARSF